MNYKIAIKIAFVGLLGLMNSAFAATDTSPSNNYQAPAELVIAIYNNCIDKPATVTDINVDNALLACVNEDLALLGFNKITSQSTLIALIEK